MGPARIFRASARVFSGMHDGFPLTDPAFLERYEPGPLLGMGGMARVYRATHRQLARPVAIKLFTPELSAGPDGLARFIAEARMAAGLIHPNVVVVFDYGVAGDVPYLVTELVEGRTLASILRERGALTMPEVLAISQQVLGGLAAIHAKAIIHRDLKPDNILIAEDGGVAKIADFGIAKQVHVSGPDTVSGVILGTPAFMAPEQIANDPPSSATDLYAFALVMHRMITGRHPFEAATTLDLLHQQLVAEPQLAPELHPAVAALLARALRKRPQERFASARELAEELDLVAVQLDRSSSFFVEALSALPPPSFSTRPELDTLISRSTGATRPVRAPRPRRAAFAFLALTVAVGLAVPALRLLGLRRAPPAWAPVDADPPAAVSTARPTLDAVIASARDLQPQDAARALFAYTRAHPELAGVRLVSDLPALAVAQDVDRAALDVLEAGLRRPASGGAMEEIPAHVAGGRARMVAHAGASAPVAGDEFVLELIDDLRDRRDGEAKSLVRAFMDIRHPIVNDESTCPIASPDATSLHPANAFVFAGGLAGLRAAGSLGDLVLAVRELEVIARTHPGHPAGDAARGLVADVLVAAGVPGAFGADLAPPAGNPLAAWPKLAQLVEGTRRHVARRWLDGQAVSAADLRRALLVSEVINHLNARWWRGSGETGPYGDVRHLSSFFEKRDVDPAVDWLYDELDDTDEFQIDSRLPRALVLDIATRLTAARPALLDAVRGDLALDPPRKAHMPRALRSRDAGE